MRGIGHDHLASESRFIMRMALIYAASGESSLELRIALGLFFLPSLPAWSSSCLFVIPPLIERVHHGKGNQREPDRHTMEKQADIICEKALPTSI
jgi:hypothetical protein